MESLFQSFINIISENRKAFLFLLIGRRASRYLTVLIDANPYEPDEVESITMARSLSLKGNEPGDSLRVVNSILTQLDRLKVYSNILIFATSNFSEAIGMSSRMDAGPF